MRKVIEVLRTSILPEEILPLIDAFYERRVMYYKKKRVNGWITRRPHLDLPQHCIPWMVSQTPGYNLAKPGNSRGQIFPNPTRGGGITKGTNKQGRIFYIVSYRISQEPGKRPVDGCDTVYLPNTPEEYLGIPIVTHEPMTYGWNCNYLLSEIEFLPM